MEFSVRDGNERRQELKKKGTAIMVTNVYFYFKKFYKWNFFNQNTYYFK